LTAQDSHLPFIANLNSNDVVLGRGVSIARYQGNIRFRELIGSRKAEYNSTSRHNIKTDIAIQVYQAIASRQGRFVRLIESMEEAQKVGVPNGMQVWVVGDESTAMSKIKQALREMPATKSIVQNRFTLNGAARVKKRKHAALPVQSDFKVKAAGLDSARERGCSTQTIYPLAGDDMAKHPTGCHALLSTDGVDFSQNDAFNCPPVAKALYRNATITSSKAKQNAQSKHDLDTASKGRCKKHHSELYYSMMMAMLQADESTTKSASSALALTVPTEIMPEFPVGTLDERGEKLSVVSIESVALS
jgi:hypothetical protein